MHCYVSVRDAAPGEARNIAAAAVGDNLSLKLVVVVDDDVDVACSEPAAAASPADAVTMTSSAAKAARRVMEDATDMVGFL
jgi:hypothetical protein